MAMMGQHIAIRAIMRKTGITSTYMVAHHLAKLVNAGYITRGPKYHAGTWRVVVPLITAQGSGSSQASGDAGILRRVALGPQHRGPTAIVLDAYRQN